MEGAQLEAACTVSAESAPRRLNGSWHACLWIYEGFFGLLLLQCTAGIGRPLAWGCVGSVSWDHGLACQRAQLMGCWVQLYLMQML